MLALLLPLTAKANEPVILNSANTVTIRGEISASSVTVAQLQLAKLAVKRGAKNYPLYLVLDSPGGSIEAGFMFIEFTKMIRNLHTISIFSASMASAIVESLPGRRLVTENGTLMFHQAYAGAEGTVEVGSLESRVYYIKRRVQALERANSNRMKMDIAKYKDLVSREMWLDADDSVKNNAADAKVDIICTPELVASTTQVGYASIFGQVVFQFSNCPLFRVPLSGSDARVKFSLPMSK